MKDSDNRNTGSQVKVRIRHLEDTQAKEIKANSCIIVEEERTYDVRSPDHVLKPATTRRTSRDPTSRGNKRNEDDARVISQ